MRSRRTLATVAAVAAAMSVLGPGRMAAAATPTDLFISEYVEGSANNKALELFNGTGSPIDLAAGGYGVQIYFNGATVAGAPTPPARPGGGGGGVVPAPPPPAPQ